MKKESANEIIFDDVLGCFGDFDVRDPVCRKFCALNLRCAVECYRNDQMELWEEMVTADVNFAF